MMRLYWVLGWVIASGGGVLSARPFTVVVYNVENLFDADGEAAYEDYQPAFYRPAHVLTKITNIARVLQQYEEGRGPDLVLLQEIEIDRTRAAGAYSPEAVLRAYADTRLDALLGPELSPEVRDWPAEVLLLKGLADHGLMGYTVVTADEPPETHPRDGRPRAVQCVLLTRFPVRAVRTHPTTARRILEVVVEVNGHPLYVFNNHWKSGASDPATEGARIASARTLRARLDEILQRDPQADILIGGDFNSHYNQGRRYPAMERTGIDQVLKAQGNEAALPRGRADLYNLWYELPPAERGSDTYRGEWGTLMQLIVSRGLYDYGGVQYIDNSFAVGRFPGLNALPDGTPRRWTFGGPRGGGFSDHFPLSARFRVAPEQQPGRWLELTDASRETAGPIEINRVPPAVIDWAAVARQTRELAAEVNLQDGDYVGEVFRVEGPVVEGSQLAVEFRGQVYDIWSPDPELRQRLRESHRAGDHIRFYGELGLFRGQWQWVIREASWWR